jgi:hypothetical protein
MSASNRGGGDKLLSYRVGRAGCPEHDRDVALASAAYRKIYNEMIAKKIAGACSLVTHQVFKFVRSVSYSLQGRPFYTLSEKCRASLMKIAGWTELPPLKEAEVPPSLRNLPKRPPQAPKKEEDE